METFKNFLLCPYRLSKAFSIQRVLLNESVFNENVVKYVCLCTQSVSSVFASSIFTCPSFFMVWKKLTYPYLSPLFHTKIVETVTVFSQLFVFTHFLFTPQHNPKHNRLSERRIRCWKPIFRNCPNSSTSLMILVGAKDQMRFQSILNEGLRTAPNSMAMPQRLHVQECRFEAGSNFHLASLTFSKHLVVWHVLMGITN